MKNIYAYVLICTYISPDSVFYQLKTVLKNASFVKQLGIRTLDAFILSTNVKPTVGVAKFIQEKRGKKKGYFNTRHVRSTAGSGKKRKM